MLFLFNKKPWGFKIFGLIKPQVFRSFGVLTSRFVAGVFLGPRKTPFAIASASEGFPIVTRSVKDVKKKTEEFCGCPPPESS